MIKFVTDLIKRSTNFLDSDKSKDWIISLVAPSSISSVNSFTIRHHKGSLKATIQINNEMLIAKLNAKFPDKEGVSAGEFSQYEFNGIGELIMLLNIISLHQAIPKTLLEQLLVLLRENDEASAFLMGKTNKDLGVMSCTVGLNLELLARLCSENNVRGQAYNHELMSYAVRNIISDYIAQEEIKHGIQRIQIIGAIGGILKAGRLICVEAAIEAQRFLQTKFSGLYAINSNSNTFAPTAINEQSVSETLIAIEAGLRIFLVPDAEKIDEHNPVYQAWQNLIKQMNSACSYDPEIVSCSTSHRFLYG